MTALNLEGVGDFSVKEAGAWEGLASISQRINGAWVKLWDSTLPLSVTVDNQYPYGAGASSGTIVVQSAPVVLTIIGGTAPFTIAWARVGTGSPAWAISSPAALETRFSTTAASGVSELADFQATITDANGQIETSPIVSASIENFGGYL